MIKNRKFSTYARNIFRHSKFEIVRMLVNVKENSLKNILFSYQVEYHVTLDKMYFNSKIQSISIRCIWVIFFSLPNISFVRSVIVNQNITNNSTCQTITFNNDQMYQCDYTLYSKELSERIILNFNLLQLNCSDHLYIYDSANTSGDPAYILTCKNTTRSVIYSTSNAVSLIYVTADYLGLNSKDFYLAYTSFNESTSVCDGFVCGDERKYCISGESHCDGYYHCSDGSDESDCMMYDDSDDKIKLIALVCFASFILLLGIIWLCAHTKKVMRNRAIIQRNGVVNN